MSTGSSGREVALQAARSIAPMVAARALEAEKNRRLPAETYDALRGSGLFRLLVPKRVGGAEAEFGALVDVARELAHGCASTAWVFANLASHGWMLGMWPGEAQQKVWASGPDTLIAASLIYPAGRAVKTAGGYRLRGKWPFASGIDESGWSMLGGTVEGDEENPGEYRIFLLPSSAYRVNDTWFALGLAATASKEIAVSECFVPEHMTLGLNEVLGGATPGSAVNPGPLYRIPLLATAGHVVIGVLLGTARGVLEHFGREDRNRVSAYSGRAMKDFESVQIGFAEASAASQAAERLILADCEEIMRIAASGAPPGVLDKARLRRNSAYAAKLCKESVDQLFGSMGGGALFLNHPLQRAFRDIHAAGAHIALSWARATQHFGKAVLGHVTDIAPHER